MMSESRSTMMKVVHASSDSIERDTIKSNLNEFTKTHNIFLHTENDRTQSDYRNAKAFIIIANSNKEDYKDNTQRLIMDFKKIAPNTPIFIIADKDADLIPMLENYSYENLTLKITDLSQLKKNELETLFSDIIKITAQHQAEYQSNAAASAAATTPAIPTNQSTPRQYRAISLIREALNAGNPTSKGIKEMNVIIDNSNLNPAQKLEQIKEVANKRLKKPYMKDKKPDSQKSGVSFFDKIKEKASNFVVKVRNPYHQALYTALGNMDLNEPLKTVESLKEDLAESLTLAKSLKEDTAPKKRR